MRIPFNKPYFTGKETGYIKEAVASGKISGNGEFTKKCHQFFEKKYGFKKCLLTTSCTDALEMAAILTEINKGDEVIVPSYTFVSTANAFVLRGANIVFADSCTDHPNIDVDNLEKLITPKTKALVIVHYAGIACNMDAIMKLVNKYNLYLIEDAAQAIDSYYKGKPLGSFGHFSTFSFHETKNIMSGEGGMLVINDSSFFERSEIIWEKGTNRTAFFRGEVNKYEWIDIGSSFLPSEITAAFLWAQLENLDVIQAQRQQIWDTYFKGLKKLQDANLLKLPIIQEGCTNNAHLFYIVCKNIHEQKELISFLRKKNIHAVFHYLSLHKSTFFENKYKGEELINSDRFEKCLVRLPLYYELTNYEQKFIINEIEKFYIN